MATQITQIDSPDGQRTTLRVEGEMLLDDAVLLEKLVKCLADEAGEKTIVIDLADLDFLDSDAASILKKLDDAHQCEIKGIEIFLQSAVDMAERATNT